MSTLRVNWLALGLEFVRLRPKTSATIAFELGLLAAAAVKRARARKGSKTISSSFIDLAPSLGDLSSYLSDRPATPKRRRKPSTPRPPRLKKAS